MEQGLFQAQKLSQELTMAPQQIQSLEILQLPMLELQQKVSEELEINPTLEMVEVGGEELVGDPLSEKLHDCQSDEIVAGEMAAKDESLCSLISVDPNWRDQAGSNPDADSKRQHFFDSLTEEQGLQNVLVDQLRTSDLEGKHKDIAEQLIGNIDDTGYLRTHIADLAIICSSDARTIKSVLKIIQSFEPLGVGSRDLQECLSIQLKKMGREKSLEYKIVNKHLDMIEKNHIPQLAKKLNVTPCKIYDALKLIQQLQPYPGSGYASGSAQFTAPETEIYPEGDFFRARALKERLPNLRISQHYLDILENPETKSEVKKYIREKITSSKMLMRSLDHRESTIVKITQVLADIQRKFFIDGVDKMRPLTMQVVADEIGVHETTVSRAINQKYVQTPRGLYPFKYFFNSGYTSVSGEVVTSLSIKNRISELIVEEDRKKPLADQELVDALNTMGFSIARRTVAKYREEQGLAPSNLRRSY